MLCFGDFWRWNISMNCLYVVKINIRNEEEDRFGRNILVFLIGVSGKKRRLFILWIQMVVLRRE